MSPRRRYFASSLLLLAVLVVGGSAGVVASLAMNRSLEEYAAGLFAGRRPATPNGGGQRATPGLYEGGLERVMEVSAPSMALLTTPTIDSRLRTSWVTQDDAFGYGVVVSTDGWVLVHRDVVHGVSNVLRGVEVWVGGTRYIPEQYVVDSLTDFALIKISANGLTPAAFGASEDVSAGARVFVLQGISVTGTQVVTTTAQEGDVLPAEQYGDAWVLADAVATGAGVFSWAGDLLAVTGTSAALPIHYGAAFVREVIRSGTPMHAGLGAEVVDIGGVLNMDPAMRQGREDGALVVGVLGVSPAQTAGLQVGDVVIAVDDVRITSDVTLAEQLRLYDPGQSAQLKVVRDANEMQLAVTFVDAGELVY